MALVISVFWPKPNEEATRRMTMWNKAVKMTTISKWTLSVRTDLSTGPDSDFISYLPCTQGKPSEERSTCLAPFYGCLNFLLHVPTKTPKQTRNRVKQLCNFISVMEIHANYVVICCSCCSVQNYCFCLALVYCQPLDHIFCSQCCSASDTETARLFQCCVHHTVSKTTFNKCSHFESRKSKENKQNI